MSLGLRGASPGLAPACATGSRASSFRQRLVLLSAAAVAIAVVLASAITFVIVRSELRGEVDQQPDATRSSRISVPAELLLPGQPSPGENVLVLPPGPARQPRRVRPGRAAERLGGPAARQSHPPARSTSGRSRSPRANARPSSPTRRSAASTRASTRHRCRPATRVQAVRPLEEVDRTLRDLTFALVLVGLGGIALAVWLGLPGGARRADAGEAAHRRGRARRPHARPQRRIRADGIRRAQPPGRQLQHDARGARRRRSARSASSSRTPRTSCARRSPACARTSRCLSVGCAAAGGPRAPAARRRRPARRADGAGRGPGRPGARRRARRWSRRTCASTCWWRTPSSARAGTRPTRRSSPSSSPAWSQGVPAPPRPGRHEPARQRRQVEPARRPDRGPRARRRGQRARPRARASTDADLPYVFDRFYRAPAARGPAGLGARPGDRAPGRRVARRHGGGRAANGGGARMACGCAVTD